MTRAMERTSPARTPSARDVMEVTPATLAPAPRLSLVGSAGSHIQRRGTRSCHWPHRRPRLSSDRRVTFAAEVMEMRNGVIALTGVAVLALCTGVYALPPCDPRTNP